MSKKTSVKLPVEKKEPIEPVEILGSDIKAIKNAMERLLKTLGQRRFLIALLRSEIGYSVISKTQIERVLDNLEFIARQIK